MDKQIVVYPQNGKLLRKFLKNLELLIYARIWLNFRNITLSESHPQKNSYCTIPFVIIEKANDCIVMNSTAYSQGSLQRDVRELLVVMLIFPILIVPMVIQGHTFFKMHCVVHLK